AASTSRASARLPRKASPRKSRPTPRAARPRCNRALDRLDGRDAFQVAASPFASRITLHELPETCVVPGHDQVAELVQDHVVADPGGHVAYLLGDPHRAVRRRARTPASVLIGDPANACRVD